MSFNQYSATHKTWDHVGNITPNVEYSEPHRPHGEYLVADWLPVGRYDKHYEDYFVVSAGKIVAFDRVGRVVPAGMKVAFSAGTGDVLEYDATDAAEGVIDLGTGAPCVTGAAYTAAELATALFNQGLIDAGETAASFISDPVGVAPYNYYHWAGGDGFNPSEYRLHNYNMQHRVAILCKYVVEMPLVPGDEASSNLATAYAASIVDTLIDDWTEDVTAAGAFYSATGLGLTARYAGVISAGDGVIALNLQVMNLAKNTPLTPVSLPAGFVLERESLAEVLASGTLGHYWIDYDVGVILVADGATGTVVPASLQTGTATFHAYDSIPTSVSSFACALGALKPGSYLVSDANSNFVEARSFGGTDDEFASQGSGTADDNDLAAMSQAVADRQDSIIGQVLDSELFPKDYLDRVRTAYPDLGTLDQMPGTASGGLRDQLTYAGASNKMVRILLLK